MAGPKRRTAWLLYAAALTVTVLIGEIGRGARPDAVALAGWVLNAALLVAVWSYALRRPLGSERYWRVVFWIVLFATVLMLLPVLARGGAIARYTLALTVPVIPAYVAAYLYAYRSPALWRKSGSGAD